MTSSPEDPALPALRRQYLDRLEHLLRTACAQWQEQEGMPLTPLRLDYFSEYALDTPLRQPLKLARSGAEDMNVSSLSSRQAFERIVRALEPWVEAGDLGAFVTFVETQFLDVELRHNQEFRARQRPEDEPPAGD